MRQTSKVLSEQNVGNVGNLDIVHLKMVNIVLALRLFAQYWTGTRILIKCDNDAVVKVLNAGKARDPYLGACARNVWYMAALSDRYYALYFQIMGH